MNTIYFEVNTVLKKKIRSTKQYWEKIINKHPPVKNLVDETKETLKEPDEIRVSRKDESVFLYYRHYRNFILCVVVRHINKRRIYHYCLSNEECKNWEEHMEKIVKVFYDEEGNTMNIWFDDPKKEVICEEIDDETILKKDRVGRVIGFEKLNFLSEKVWKKQPKVEIVVG